MQVFIAIYCLAWNPMLPVPKRRTRIAYLIQGNSIVFHLFCNYN